MEASRLVGVVGPDGPGTGCLVGPRLVLTSAHLVRENGARVELFRPRHDGTHAGEVVWCGTPHGRDDAALVRVTDSAWPERAGRPLRWGRFVTHRTGRQAAIWGLPNVVQRPGRDIEAYQLTCEVNPGSGLVHDRHYCALRQHPPTWDDPGSSPWGGLSGAPLYCGDLLVGVVAVDPAHFAHGTLTAVPVPVLDSDPDFRAVLAAAGAYTPPEGVELSALADLGRRPPTAPPASPAGLLRPERNVVPFYGRTETLADLGDWCAADGFGALLLHGAGGQGKTRLAGRLAAGLTAAPADRPGDRPPWQVLWPAPETRPDDLEVVRDVAAPLLVVLDYAETRPEQAAALLRAAAAHSGEHPLKLLFLARSDGDWWTALRTREAYARDLLAGARELALTGLQPDPDDRQPAYRRALTAFAATLSTLPAPNGPARPDWADLAAALPPPTLDRSGHGNALTLHMTALVDLLDAAAPKGPGAPRGPLHDDAEHVEDRLLEHEGGYWRNSARTRPDLHGHLSQDTLEDALAAALLVGGVDREEADAVLRRLPSFEGITRSRRNSVRAWIAGLYPPAGTTTWGSLEPDRLAERFVGRRLHDDPALAHHLAQGAAPAQAAHLLDLYTRAAAHPVFHGELDAPLRDLCLAHREVLAPHAVGLATRTTTPEPLLAALDAVLADPALDPGMLRRLAGSLPSYSERLAPWAAVLTERVVAHHRARPPDDPARSPHLATSLGNLAQRANDLGDRERGLAAATESVTLWKSLAAAQHGRWQPELAAGLATLSGRLADFGRGEESLEAIRESLAIRRRLADQDRDAHLGELAAGLLNLAVRLDELGRLPESLVASREAAALYGELYGRRPARHRAPYAHALHTHAIALRRTGHLPQACEQAEEAVRLRRELAAQLPDAHLRDLGMSLTTLANVREQLGHLETAVTTAYEAVGVARALMSRRPESHLRLFVSALVGLANRLHALGRHDEALAISEEAATGARTCAAERPETDGVLFAHTLKNLSADLATVGRHDSALDAALEAVSALRDAARTNPGEARAELPGPLRQSASCLTMLGRTAEALEPTAEAITLLTALADEEPLRHQPDLATAHLAHGELLRLLGRTEESLDAVESAVRLLRRMDGLPAGYDPLTTALVIDRYAMQRHAGRRWGPALRGVDTALRLHRTADPPRPGVTATFLHHRAVILLALQRHDEADRDLAEAIGLRRAIVSTDPRAYVPDLLDALGTRVWCLGESGRLPEAASVLADSLEVVRTPLRALPGVPPASWALPLYRIAAAGARLASTRQDRERAAEAAALLEPRPRQQVPAPDISRANRLLASLRPPGGPR
ncbi:tetratricopeptide repeat protein [Streptomyces achromogenes]|uniref:tetratricopeptide repeat protein n=1 Tax=Streptomyces achromogenes TaxID=67255 RepID=UPI0036F9CBFD